MTKQHIAKRISRGRALLPVHLTEAISAWPGDQIVIYETPRAKGKLFVCVSGVQSLQLPSGAKEVSRNRVDRDGNVHLSRGYLAKIARINTPIKAVYDARNNRIALSAA